MVRQGIKPGERHVRCPWVLLSAWLGLLSAICGSRGIGCRCGCGSGSGAGDSRPNDSPDEVGSGGGNVSGGVEKVFMFGYVSRGKKGEAVKMCQAALNIRARAGLAVDGSCGPATDAAIRNWQRTHRLVVDGSCGPATWDSLLRE